MRELSLVELELVVGGYYEQYDYSSTSTATDNGDGTFNATVLDSEADAMADSVHAMGIDWSVEAKVGNGGSWSVSGKVSGKS